MPTTIQQDTKKTEKKSVKAKAIEKLGPKERTIKQKANDAARSSRKRRIDARKAQEKFNANTGRGPANRVPIQGSAAQPTLANKLPATQGGLPQSGGMKGGLPAVGQRGLANTASYSPDWGPRVEKDITPKGMEKWARANPRLAKMIPNLIKSGAGSSVLKLLGVPASIIATILAPKTMGEGSMAGVDVKGYDWGSAEVGVSDDPVTEEILNITNAGNERAASAATATPRAPAPAPAATVEEILPYLLQEQQQGEQERIITEPADIAELRAGHMGLLDWGDADLPQYQY